MSNSVYKKLELVGTSPNSISEAIENAIGTACAGSEKVTWFEVSEIRGHVENGKVSQYQVAMKVGSKVDS